MVQYYFLCVVLFHETSHYFDLAGSCVAVSCSIIPSGFLRGVTTRIGRGISRLNCSRKTLACVAGGFLMRFSFVVHTGLVLKQFLK